MGSFPLFCGLEFPGGDGRLTILRELSIKLLLTYFYREEALSTGISYLQGRARKPGKTRLSATSNDR
jgi:hypothetical protein